MSGFRMGPPRPPTPPPPKEPVPTVLIGMVFDLSWTMGNTFVERRTENKNTTSNVIKEPWAASFLRLMEDLVQKNEVAHIETFAFGAGGQARQLPSEFRRDSVVLEDASRIRRDSTTRGDANQSRRDSAARGDATQSRRDSTAHGDANQSRRDSTARGDATLSRRDSTARGDATQSRRDSTTRGDATQSRRDSTARIIIVLPLRDSVSGGTQSGNVADATEEASPNENVELTPVVFDILRTIEDFGKGDDVLERVKIKQKNHKSRSADRIVDDVMSLLEHHGAHSIREWVSPKQVSEILDEHDHISALLLAMLEEDPQFLRAVVNTCLPKPCLKSTAWDINHPGRCLWEMFFGALYAGVKVAVPTKIDSEIRKARIQARDIWLKMHPPPGTRAVVTEVAVYEGKRAIEILRGPFPRTAKNDARITDARMKQILAQASPYIFGGTPLIEALDEAVKVFESSKADEKVLFVVSDGMANDNKTVTKGIKTKRSPPIEALKAMKVHVISCYIDVTYDSSANKGVSGKSLYCKPGDNWVKGARFMFDLSSTISTQRIPKTIFIQRDWTIQIDNNETRLFAHVNHPKLLNEMVSLARELACSQDALCDLLGSVSLDLFINTVNDSFTAPQQVGGTCYANAVGAVVYMAMKRIYKRAADPLPNVRTEEKQIPNPSDEKHSSWSLFKDDKRQKRKVEERLRLEGDYKTGYPYFDETEAGSQRQNFLLLRDELIKNQEDQDKGTKNEGRKGAKTAEVLKRVCAKYRLQYLKVEQIAALKAVSNQQPVVATFRLTKDGWEKFKKFFQRKPRRVLRYGDMGPQKGDLQGHAVVFTSYSSKGLTFMNSWGTGWGNNGFFTLENSRVVTTMTFYTVFWELNDLKDIEKRAYQKSGSEVLEKLVDKYCALNKAVHVCDKCGKPSKVVEYEGYYAEAKCPKCGRCVLGTSDYPDLVLALYLKGGQGVVGEDDDAVN